MASSVIEIKSVTRIEGGMKVIINLDERRAWIGRGQPCRADYYEYALEPWVPPPGWPR